MSLTEDALRWLGETEDKYLFCVLDRDHYNNNYTFIDSYEDALNYYNEKNTQKNYIKLYKVGKYYYDKILKGKI